MSGRPPSHDWVELLKSLPHFQEPPPGYLPLPEYAERSHTSKSTIQRAVRSGLIDKRHCVTLPPSKHQSKDRLQMAIDWNATAYGYIVRKPLGRRPADFVENDAREYMPIDVDDSEDPTQLPLTFDGSADPDVIKFRPIRDLADAKFRKEQLAIIEKQNAIKMANNELIRVEDVVAHEREIALEIKAEIKRGESKMAPLLAAATTVQKCRSILEDGHRKIFEELLKMEQEREIIEDSETDEQ